MAELIVVRHVCGAEGFVVHGDLIEGSVEVEAGLRIPRRHNRSELEAVAVENRDPRGGLGGERGSVNEDIHGTAGVRLDDVVPLSVVDRSGQREAGVGGRVATKFFPPSLGG